MGVIEIAMTVMWTVAAGAMALYVAKVAGEVTYVTLADGRREARALPLVFKLLLPFCPNLDSLVRRKAFDGQIALAERRLVAAGFEGLLSGREFIELKLLVPVVFGLAFAVVVFLAGSIVPDSFLASLRLPLVFLGFALGYLQPIAWLSGALRRRHAEIVKALPFVLDILTLSVEAGMDFISALQRNCASRRLDALNEELLRMTKEIQVGSSRKTALKAMADRVGEPNLRSVAFALVQADELGVSIGSILRIQSEQLRSRRFDLAEKKANEAPTKMLAPLMLCIFPAVFIILLVPVLTQALKGIF